MTAQASRRLGTKHKWEMDAGEAIIMRCRLCGLVKCETWPDDDSLQPIVEYSKADGQVLVRGRPNKTSVPACAEGKYL